MKRAVSTTNPKDRIGITKVPLGLIPLIAQVHTSLAHLDGMLKYGKANWRRESVSASIYYDAALRHILKFVDGETFDAESGIHHLGHAGACLNIIMDAEASGNLIDDRPQASDGPAMLDAYRGEVIRLLGVHGIDIPNTPSLVQESDSANS